MGRFAGVTAGILLASAVAGCLAPGPASDSGVQTSTVASGGLLDLVIDLPVDGDRARELVFRISTDFPFRAGDDSPAKLGARAMLVTQLQAAGLEVVEHAYAVEGQDVRTGEPRKFTGANVLGVLPGSTDSWIVVGAHYDSVSSSPGAWDDGSGTAVVLELARSAASRQWSHGLIFAFWDDEEEGLVGSEAFVFDHLESDPPVYDVAAMIQFDAPGYNYPCEDPGLGPLPLDIYHGTPGWRAQDAINAALNATLVERAYPQHAIRVREGEIVTNPPSGVLGRGTSDHASFAHAGVPYLFVFSSTSHRVARVDAPSPAGPRAVDSPWTHQFHNEHDTYEQLLLRCQNDPAKLAQAYQTPLDVTMGTLIRFDAIA